MYTRAYVNGTYRVPPIDILLCVPQKLDALEREEEERMASGVYEEEEEDFSEDEEIKEMAAKIREKKLLVVQEHRLKKGTKVRETLSPPSVPPFVMSSGKVCLCLLPVSVRAFSPFHAARVFSDGTVPRSGLF